MDSWLLLEKGPFRKVLVAPCSDTRGVSEVSAISFSSVGQPGKLTNAIKMDILRDVVVNSSNYDNIRDQPIYGCLGLIRIELVTAVRSVGLIAGRRIYRIDDIDFICITSSKYDSITVPGSVTSSSVNDDSGGRRRGRFAVADHPCSDLASFLAEGFFYFGYDWDATKSLQKSIKRGDSFSWSTCERSFFWNRMLMKPIMKFSATLSSKEASSIRSAGVFVACFEGFAEIQEFPFGNSVASFAVISRVSCKRAGTRYRSRGIDDDGNVSNFVETETLLCHQAFTFSHQIIRGTIPIFWDQQGFQLGFPRIQLTRTPPATQPAFDRHFNDLQDSYGLVHVIDLLNQKEGQAENVLSNAFDFHIRKFPDVGVLSQTTFDVYSVCKNNNFERLDSLFHLIGRDLQVFGYFVMDASGAVIKEQRGIFRVNCLDCLDRTNIVQSYIVKRTVDLFIRTYLLGSGVTYDAFLFQTTLRNLWTNNGDQLSRIYTGSNAIKSSYGRLGRFTFSNLIEDFKNNARRFYSNNFSEKVRQKAVDTLLGKSPIITPVLIYSPSRDIVEEELSRRRPEYCDREMIIVQALTWNTNAAVPVTGEDYTSLVSFTKGLQAPHVVAIGFQEIVQLNATQIMSVDPERRILWEGCILRLLNERYPKSPFSLLVSHQLVGTTICVFSRSDLLDVVRTVEIASKKTGMGGMAGNKGSVAVRMEIFDSSFCFVSSHFTAGQANAFERDRDYSFAINELQLSGGRDILAHDVVFWFGDMNYRIDLDRDSVKELIMEKSYSVLHEYDQLASHLKEGMIFKGFSEGSINFAPTYKYDLGTNIYDSSEKMRVPSWTDRILFKGDDIRCIYYDRAEIDISDHKPVKGLYEVPIFKVDKSKESKLRSEIMQSSAVYYEDEYCLYFFFSLSRGSECELTTATLGSCFDLIDLNEGEEPPPLPPRPRTSTT